MEQSAAMWFNGPIENAISKAKSEKRLLIVFICGADDNSKRVLDYWTDDGVEKVVTDNCCIALKLEEGSASAKHFAQIYPVIHIPICFFISTSGGVPLEVLVNFDSLESFKERLVKTVDGFRNGVTSSEAPSSPPRQSGESHAAATSPVVQPERVVAQTEAASPETGTQQATSSTGIQERVQKANQLIKERQEQKTLEDEENARMAEMKRRQEGQDFQKAQERVKETEALRNAYDQKKAKKEDKEHLKKLREQIAADRAEKASKFSTSQTEQKQQQDTKKEQKMEMDERQRQEEEEQRKRFSLLQFRLPDGSSVRNQFDGAALFSAAEAWFAQETNSTASSFVLVQMYPRREFTSEDRTRSLVELGLTPSAVLMVLPNASAGASLRGPQQGGNSTVVWLFSTIFTTVTAPVRYLYGLLYTFVFGAAAPRPVTGPTDTNKSPVGSDQRPGSSGGGNIVRFQNAEDANKDDDNATWNGNSTQQL